MKPAEIEAAISRVKKAGGSGREQSRRLIGLAEVISNKGAKSEAYELCRTVLASYPDDSEFLVRVRRVLARLVPSYHLSMMNDTRRNSAWERALTQIVRPGMRVFEIGTGAGLLALLAARAGGTVYTCEDDPFIATMAKEIVGLNHLDHRVKVLKKKSQEVDATTDLGGQVDLVFGDIFADNFFAFEPLALINDARSRLLKADGRVLPEAAAVRIALGNWLDYRRLCRVDSSLGFDITPMSAFIPDAVRVSISDPNLTLLSDPYEAFHFDFTQAAQPDKGEVTINVSANQTAVVNGIVQWIRLSLCDEILESKPQSDSVTFSSPVFYPLISPVSMTKADVARVHLNHDMRRLTVWVEV